MEKLWNVVFGAVLSLAMVSEVLCVGECNSSPCVLGSCREVSTGGYICICPNGQSHGTNCQLTFTTARTCGSNYISNTMTIQSPNFPNDYRPNDYCVYLIQVVDAQKLQFEITYFEVEVDSKDPFEYGSGSTVDTNLAIAQFDGNSQSLQSDKLPHTFTVNSNQAWLLFTTDNTNQYPGFSITYTADLDSCATNPCLNGGMCTDGDFTFTCSCAAGWQGTNCDMNINECFSNPCRNLGQCDDGNNMFTCNCAPGWQGTTCEWLLLIVIWGQFHRAA